MQNLIEKYRKENGISQEELGKPIGWNQSRISNYERRIRTPDINDARLLLQAFKAHGIALTLDQLFPSQDAA